MGSLFSSAGLRFLLKPAKPAPHHAGRHANQNRAASPRSAPLPEHSSTGPQAAGIGTVIETSFRLFPFLPLRAPWIALITEFERNHYFADIQQKGPFKRWHHRHEFMEETRQGIRGTLVRDVIEYEFGLGPLEALANSFLIEPKMRTMFAQRQKALPALLS